MSGENPTPPPTQTPPTPSPVGPVPDPVQPLRCPYCSTIVSQGTAYCSNCGNALPPSGQIFAPPPQPQRSRKGLITGIVLIALILAGGLGYFLYWNNQQQQLALQVAKTSEQTDATQSPNQIRATCVSVASDNSHLSYNQFSGYSGYATVSLTFGLSNPTRFIIDSTWTVTYDYTSIALVLTSSASFHLPAEGAARPVFPFTITGQQYNSLPSHPDFSIFTGNLDATYKVVGTYGTYSIPQHLSFDSSTGSGSGGIGSSNNLPPCS